MYGEEMPNTIWTPALSLLGIALLVSSCAADPTASQEEVTPGAVETADSTSDETADRTEPAAHGDDLYAPPLPPASEAPPVYPYDDAPTPEAPRDHEPVVTAFQQALDQGAQPDDQGLIELASPIGALTIDGEDFTIDGVIDPGNATPLYEDEIGGGGFNAIVEELTGIPWPDRRAEHLDDDESETACGGADQYVWVSYDRADSPTCFEESGGVTGPYFRTISAVCHSSESKQARTMYMGLGGDYSFSQPLGDGTGWDMIYRGPQASGTNSCYAFTVPVRGAVTALGIDAS